jgi:ubiquinone/menaquinone biosynthesis C-methylase UbiE
MSPLVFAAFGEIIAAFFAKAPPSSAMEIGATEWTLLSLPEFDAAQRIALNLKFDSTNGRLDRCTCVEGSARKMAFADGTFDCVMSCSVFEHDRDFWVSVGECRRVLKPGGLWIIGVPIYMSLPTDVGRTTVTYARHGYAYNADYYRFSEQAVREVLLQGYEPYAEKLVRRYPNPYMVAAGCKR